LTKGDLLLLRERDEKEKSVKKEKRAELEGMALLLQVAVLAAWAHVAAAELLTPPYFNLAEGRRISATATCGEGTPGPELYCKLVGATTEDTQNIIHGQVSQF